jgi:hypothetical protein
MATKNRPFIVFLLILLAAASCTKELDQVPHQIYYDNFYQTGEDALSAVNAVYDVLGQVSQYSNYLWLIQDICSDDCNARVTLNDPHLHDFNNYTVEPNNNYLARIWQGSYLGISRVNVVLENGFHRTAKDHWGGKILTRVVLFQPGKAVR